MRPLFVWLHRWAGLIMTIFLVIVGLTGSVLAFRDEIDGWLNPQLLHVLPRDVPMLDPLDLRDTVAARFPNFRVDSATLHVKTGRSIEYDLIPTDDAATFPTQAFFDPYTGKELGTRVWGKASLSKEDIVGFLYRLHMSLAWPLNAGDWGATILGIVALAWTIDCFIAFYLTFPLRFSASRSSRIDRSWWSRWKPAWLIRWNGGAYRLNFDIHRAFGLWTWAMLFVFAWSSVWFNLGVVYKPTMTILFGWTEDESKLPVRPAPIDQPKIDWRDARFKGRIYLANKGRTHGFTVLRDDTLVYNRDHGIFYFFAHGSRDAEDEALTYVSIDAETGDLIDAVWPGKTPEKAGDFLTRWLVMLHMAHVFGLPMKIFVFIMGFVITALSFTGVYIWWKKRKARRVARGRTNESTLFSEQRKI
jgi:uncharacterized iron-regulated membrane protein